MLSMHEFMDLRVQQQLAHELYRQQIMQRIPDPFPSLLPMHMQQQQQQPQHLFMPQRPTLAGVDAKLENMELWQQFHKIGTEMIITKSGRRMFPSMRVSLSGLEADANYCVLLEMVPIGDCRYKFSGSQWVPAGGAEPQSPQRMYLHPDSPATGAHWQSQALLFSKVKLTNNTLDNNGHIVLASMHKYQPRLHVIRTAELTQLPWAPQQAFVFPETEFVAVTAYQNDRITKLKIDNNPFAKGFRESGQSRCKRKLQQHDLEPTENSSALAISAASDDDRSSVGSYDSPHGKRLRTTYEDDLCSTGSLSPRFGEAIYYATPPALAFQATTAAVAAPPTYTPHAAAAAVMLHTQPILPLNLAAAAAYFEQQQIHANNLTLPVPMPAATYLHMPEPEQEIITAINNDTNTTDAVEAEQQQQQQQIAEAAATATATAVVSTATTPSKRCNNFSISAILAY